MNRAYKVIEGVKRTMDKCFSVFKKKRMRRE